MMTKTQLLAAAKKLKELQVIGGKLKLASLENARQKGLILAPLQHQLGSHVDFLKFLSEYTDISYATAMVWIGIANNWQAVAARCSTEVEFGVNDARDFLRDMRQSAGGGRPGSGRQPASTAPTAKAETQSDAKFEKLMDRVGSPPKAEKKKASYKITVVTKDFKTFAGKLPSPVVSVKGKSVVSDVSARDVKRVLLLLAAVVDETLPSNFRMVIER